MASLETRVGQAVVEDCSPLPFLGEIHCATEVGSVVNGACKILVLIKVTVFNMHYTQVVVVVSG